MWPTGRRLMAGAGAVVAGSLLTVAPSAHAAAGYAAPVRVDDPASAVYANAAVAVNGAGDAVAIWDSGFGPGWDIYGARRPSGGSWGPPVLITRDYGGQTDAVALSSDGTAYFDARSRDDDGDGDHILTWGLDGTVADTGIGGHDDTGEVVADPAGDVVAYTVNRSRGAITYAYAKAGAPTWTSTASVAFFGTSTVAMGPRHTYYVAYASSAGPAGTVVLAVRKVDGLTGHSSVLLRRRSCAIGPLATAADLRPFDIGVSRSGGAVLAWRCTAQSGASIRAVAVDAAGRAGRPVTLARSRREHVTSRLSPPRIAYARRQATVVFSRATGGGSRSVLATTRTGGRHWTRPSVKAAAVHPARGLGMEGNLASTPDGAALYTYRNGVALYAIRRPPGGVFGRPVRLYRRSDLHGAPPGAMSPAGTATVLQLIQRSRLRARTGPI